MRPVIGIDLGTFNSCVAVVERGAPRVIANRVGSPTTPSMVAISQSGRRLVGNIAKRQAVTNAENTVHAAKRLIGCKHASEQVQLATKKVPYRIVEGPNGDPRIQLRGETYGVPEISAMVLQEMKAIAEEYLSSEVTQAVITVPAHFNDGQRQATKDAGAIAGLEVLRIINEPTAAALAYGFSKPVDKTVAVYDLGGGTFDISIMQISSSGVFKVIATSGDTYLGGEDFDDRIMTWLIERFLEAHRVDLRSDRIAMQRLKDASENAKRTLSSETVTEINLPFLISDGRGDPLHLHEVITREQLEVMTEDLVHRTLDLCALTLEEAAIERDEIEAVLLVGGMTRMPLVRHAVAAFFERDPETGVDPDEVVALGAAIQAAALVDDSQDMVLLDVTPHTLGIMVAGGRFEPLVPQNSTVPVARSKPFTTLRDGQTTVKIVVLQGESLVAQENELLGEFALTDLRAAPAGEVEIEVTFAIDADGIVSVAATDLGTGQARSLTVTASSRLTQGELERMITTAREHELLRRADASFERAREQAEELLRKITELLPAVKAAVGEGDFAQDAESKAGAAAARTRELIERGDEDELTRYVEVLTRTHRMFQGLAAAREE